MNAPPKLPGGDRAPPGHTKMPCQELADSGPRLRCVVARSAARRRNHAAMARRKAPRLPKRKMRIELNDALSRPAIPSHFLRGAPPPPPLFTGGDSPAPPVHGG